MLIINFDQNLEIDIINTVETSFENNDLGRIHRDIRELSFFLLFQRNRKGSLRKKGCKKGPPLCA